MIARLPTQPVWPDKPRRVLFIYNLNLSLIVIGLVALAGLFLVLSAGASAVVDDKPLTVKVDAPVHDEAVVVTPIIEASRVAIQPGAAIVKPHPNLNYVRASTVRLEQLIGDKDVVTNQPTVNQTQKRYGIEGTDLGYSFEHNGALFFLFGDTLGPTGGDVMAMSTTTDPDAPLRFDVVTDASGKYVRVEPPTLEMAGYETPVSGISLNGSMYVVVKSSYMPPNDQTVAAVLTRYEPSTQTFKLVRWISSLPGGHFITPTLRLVNGPIAGLSGDGPWVLMFGSGEYRNSNAYLAAVPASQWEKGTGTEYFTGVNHGTPIWSEKEGDAKPIISTPDVGDISVIYVEKLGLWVALYDSLQPRGILASYAPQPWGPWSQPVVLYKPEREPGYGVFIHDPNQAKPDGLAGPYIGDDGKAAAAYGGFYAPYIIERFTRVNGDNLTLDYVMSTWNPYVVVHMRSTLKVTQPPEPPPYQIREAYRPITGALNDVVY